MLKNEGLLAKFGVDTAENEPLRARNRARKNVGLVARNGQAGPAGVGAEPAALGAAYRSQRYHHCHGR